MNRRVKQVLEAVVRGKVDRVAVARASFLLQELKAAEERKARKRQPRLEHQAANELARKAQRELLLEAVKRRAAGDCELCGLKEATYPEDPWPLELHHLEGGPAKTKLERVANVMLVHRSCHQAYHSNEARYVGRVKAWCDLNCYPYPKRKAYR